MYREKAGVLRLVKSIRKFCDTFNKKIPREESWLALPLGVLMGTVLKPLRLRCEVNPGSSLRAELAHGLAPLGREIVSSEVQALAGCPSN